MRIANCYLPLMRVCLLLVHLLGKSSPVVIDNGVVGSPQIHCSHGSARVDFRTEKPWTGRSFVNGFSATPNCRLDRTRSTDFAVVRNSLTIDFKSCAVSRRRTANPRGLSFETTVIIQFHHTFLTKVDRAYKIICFFMQQSKEVSSSFEVSMLSTKAVKRRHELPSCYYSLHSKDFEGPSVDLAQVGDTVFHRWHCSLRSTSEEENPYGMLVHSCYVNDGRGYRVQLVDRRGCSIDPYILGHLSYSGSLLQAYREAHVFKFADRTSLSFSCQIRLCIKTMGTCFGATPPKCLPLKNKRSLDRRTAAANATSDEEQQGEDVVDIDVTTKQIVVVDRDEISAPNISGIASSRADDQLKNTGQQSVCLGPQPILMALIALFFFCLFVVIRLRRLVKQPIWLH